MFCVRCGPLTTLTDFSPPPQEEAGFFGYTPGQNLKSDHSIGIALRLPRLHHDSGSTSRAGQAWAGQCHDGSVHHRSGVPATTSHPDARRFGMHTGTLVLLRRAPDRDLPSVLRACLAHPMKKARRSRRASLGRKRRATHGHRELKLIRGGSDVAQFTFAANLCEAPATTCSAYIHETCLPVQYAANRLGDDLSVAFVKWISPPDAVSSWLCCHEARRPGSPQR
jgi:hypothetical protein